MDQQQNPRKSVRPLNSFTAERGGWYVDRSKKTPANDAQHHLPPLPRQFRAQTVRTLQHTNFTEKCNMRETERERERGRVILCLEFDYNSQVAQWPDFEKYCFPHNLTLHTLFTQFKDG